MVAKGWRTPGVARFLRTGDLGRMAPAAFGDDGSWYESVETLIDALRADLTADVNVLVKGSRFMRMERVVEALAVHDTGGEG